MDPDYDFFLQRKAVTEGKDMKERGRQANKNAYFFFSTKPSDKAKKIKIVVTERQREKLRAVFGTLSKQTDSNRYLIMSHSLLLVIQLSVIIRTFTRKRNAT